MYGSKMSVPLILYSLPGPESSSHCLGPSPCTQTKVFGNEKVVLVSYGSFHRRLFSTEKGQEEVTPDSRVTSISVPCLKNLRNKSDDVFRPWKVWESGI